MEQVTDNKRTNQISQAKIYLQEQINSMPDEINRLVCQQALERARFDVVPASSELHHTYSGGLLIHTAEVLEMALKMSECSFVEVDRNVIIISVFYHDLGKIFDYIEKADGTFDKTDHYKYIRHLSRSYAEFMDIAGAANMDETFKAKVGHVILSHHGRKEWGSPIEPLTTEAHIVHYSDMMSSYAAKDNYER